MFGVSYSGADVCGFFLNTTETLCTRWMELGAFYPFARNHNTLGTINQEPFVWDRTAEASRRALSIRYSLLPYYYTLFEESHRVGTVCIYNIILKKDRVGVSEKTELRFFLLIYHDININILLLIIRVSGVH